MTTACAYPNGGECDELTGWQEDFMRFSMACSNNERISLSTCPTEYVSGTCTWEEPSITTLGSVTRRTFHYDVTEDELADAEERCLEVMGDWSTP